MANREKYNACLSPFIKGKNKSKEQRQLDFCIGAKVCSKGVSREEAERLCRLPKAPKVPKKSRKQKQEEENSCEPNQFFEVASQFKNLYVNVHGEHCRPCAELDNLIKGADIPYQIVTVPESCIEIIDQLEITSFPTVIKMSKGKIVTKHVGNPSDTIEKMKRGE